MSAHVELRERIAGFIESIRLLNAHNEIGSDDKAARDILSLIADEVGKLPFERAHTYGSENADVYRAYDAGQERDRNRVLDLLTGGGK